jgi:hypothetical protein
VGEFNGDANSDLAVANQFSDNLSVLLGAGGGSFAAATGSPFGVGARPLSVAVGEFSGDADPDLAVANFNSNDVSVLLGANGYARPMGASPLRVSLVPAYLVCRAPNRAHGPPLDSPSCAPPEQLSQYLTVGTPDANGQPASSVGFARLGVLTGNPATVADEADVALVIAVTDVRNSQDLSDYPGELEASMTLRLTDKDIGGPLPGEQGTLADTGFRIPVPCAATPGAGGSSCSTSTTADALAPGIAREGNRAIWQLGQVRVFDGGEDGLASTDDNTIFMRQGVFVP